MSGMKVPDAARNAKSFGVAQGCVGRLKATRVLPKGVECGGSCGGGDEDVEAVWSRQVRDTRARSAERARKSSRMLGLAEAACVGIRVSRRVF